MRKFPILLVVFSLITILTYGCSGKEQPDPTGNEEQDIELKPYILGVDLSYVNQIEDHGGIYKRDNKPEDPFMLLAAKGANLVRVRLWHSPNWIKEIYGESTVIYSGPEDVAKTIKRAHDAGMSALLDFHYSDTWADPGYQAVPEAWENIQDIETLEDSVYNYTYRILNWLNNQDLLPQMVQIGNETNCGMMTTDSNPNFPNLNLCDGHWGNFGKVVNAGIRAVRDMENETGQPIKVALHVADPKNLDWWVKDAINLGEITDFDIIGFSYYPLWHTDIAFENLPQMVSDVKSKYQKEVMILETAYPFTTENNDHYGNLWSAQHPPLEGYPYTIEGQKNFLIDLNQNMADAGAIGVVYWEPAWITSAMKDLWGTGSSWENCALFDFQANLSVAADYLSEKYK
ncbi:glycoside hydrolase family 53 protein [Thermophagus xiamenensis]|uniref:Arabinogalactan endo-beta-1,4-galactanase n=1 Tax=Thermophagus xiamenensis TaxID=385682 RepID=A0A1I2CIV1_9BACT|nr:glycosyl hydrolase 53 family protein [Thermophagus xiamenensis]SFE68251.1 arabinogalactan endo-1,4-beta-galactosidase [Thermophagus xiamenensis]